MHWSLLISIFICKAVILNSVINTTKKIRTKKKFISDLFTCSVSTTLRQVSPTLLFINLHQFELALTGNIVLQKRTKCTGHCLYQFLCKAVILNSVINMKKIRTKNKYISDLFTCSVSTTLRQVGPTLTIKRAN